MPQTKINGEYFSGTQASIFIGDAWVDDIIAIDYQVQHNRTPIYGYGSQKYDFLPEGNIIVSGSFTLNFREPNYLWMILARYEAFNPQGILERSTADKNKEKARKQTRDQLKTFDLDPRRNFDLFISGSADQADSIKDELNNALVPQLGAQKAETEYFNHRIFTITIGYGADLQNAVGEKIRQVQIMGKSKVIQASGQPVQEQYSFIARDIS